MDKKLSFIYAAINDCQSTVRAIDTKLGALLTAILVPIGVIDKIWVVVKSFMSYQDHVIATIGGYLFFIIWGFIVLALIRTLSAIDNPSAHIKGASNFSGVFYCGGQFNFSWLDVILNRKNVQSIDQVSVINARHPENPANIQKELVFEQMKLVYIRDIKLYRLKCSLYGAFIWALFGLTIYGLSK